MATRYDAGRRFEWQVRDDLRNDGYEVIRSAGSKSKVDLVAVKIIGRPLFVQCKRDGRITPTEREALFRLAYMGSAVPIVAYKAKVGIGYRELTGVGPKDWVVWSADAA